MPTVYGFFEGYARDNTLSANMPVLSASRVRLCVISTNTEPWTSVWP
jgi:hypothetical protein